MGAGFVTTVYLILAVVVGLGLLAAVALPNLRGSGRTRGGSARTRGRDKHTSRTGR